MNKVDFILNKPCTLESKFGIKLTGFFYRPKKNIWFEFITNEESAQKLQLL